MKKINRRSFLAVCGATAAAAALAACGGSSSSSTAASTAASTAGSTAAAGGDFSGRTLTVGIWGGNDQETAAINQLKDNFEADHGCTVELKVYTDFNTQFQADLIGQTAPDCFYIDGVMFPFFGSLGVMDPLDPAEYELDAFYPNLVEAFTNDQGTFCVPKDVSSLATYYNIDLLEACGYTADDIPDDYDDYMAFLTDLQAKLDEVYGPNQIAAMTYNQDLSRNLCILQDGGNSLIDAEGNATLTSDGIVKNMQFIASAWIKYVTSVEGETIWCTGAGCLPPRADAAEAMDVESDPVWAVHSAMIDCALPWQLGNNASIINTAYQNYFPLAVNGEMTAAEFLQAAQDQANQEIANAG